MYQLSDVISSSKTYVTCQKCMTCIRFCIRASWVIAWFLHCTRVSRNLLLHEHVNDYNVQQTNLHSHLVLSVWVCGNILTMMYRKQQLSYPWLWNMEKNHEFESTCQCYDHIFDSIIVCTRFFLLISINLSCSRTFISRVIPTTFKISRNIASLWLESKEIIKSSNVSRLFLISPKSHKLNLISLKFFFWANNLKAWDSLGK